MGYDMSIGILKHKSLVEAQKFFPTDTFKELYSDFLFCKLYPDEYEIISGHRRRRASELAGKTDMPFIVKDYSDDEAIIIMVDSNIQREDILRSIL